MEMEDRNLGEDVVCFSKRALKVSGVMSAMASSEQVIRTAPP